MKCRLKPISTHSSEGIPLGNLTALDFDADEKAPRVLSGLCLTTDY